LQQPSYKLSFPPDAASEDGFKTVAEFVVVRVFVLAIAKHAVRGINFILQFDRDIRDL
jgi:hypothetical protein